MPADRRLDPISGRIHLSGDGDHVEMFGDYQLEELLGRGGMGEVYRAFDTRRQRTVALKRLNPGLAADAEYQERFRREFRLAARLSSPHVIPIHDFGEIDGRLFIDMRLAVGTDLGRQLDESGPLPPARAVKIVRQVADALDSAHKDGLVHRDVKPSNVLITSDDFAYLVDFGIVRAMASNTKASLTATGSAIGTLAYMAPELFTGDRIDHRVDIYALGCLLYETLTGHPPFTADGPALMYHHLNTEPPRPSARNPGLPTGFDAVVGCAMAKDRDQRYATAGQLASAAQRALPGITSGRVPPRVPAGDAAIRSAPGPTLPPPHVPPPADSDLAYPPPPPTPPWRRIKLPLIVGSACVVIALAVVATVIFATTRAAGTVGESIPVGPEPVDVEIGEGFVWTPNSSSDTISRIDPKDGTSREIKVGGDPTDVGVDQGAVWVWNYPDGITRVDVRTEEVSLVNPGNKSLISGIAVGGGYVWLSHSDNNTVTRINMRTQTPEGDPIAVGAKPVAMAFGDNRLYVVNSGDNTISTLDGRTGQVLSTSIKIGQQLGELEVHDGVIYIWSSFEAVTPIDEHSFVIGEPITIKAGSSFTVGGGSMWIAYPLDNVVRRFDLATRQQHGEPIEGIGKGSGDMIFADKVLWVSNATQNTVTQIHAGS